MEDALEVCVSADVTSLLGHFVSAPREAGEIPVPVCSWMFGRNLVPLQLLEKAFGGALWVQQQSPTAGIRPCFPSAIQLAPSSGVMGTALYPLTAGPWSYRGETTCHP